MHNFKSDFLGNNAIKIHQKQDQLLLCPIALIICKTYFSSMSIVCSSECTTYLTLIVT